MKSFVDYLNKSFINKLLFIILITGIILVSILIICFPSEAKLLIDQLYQFTNIKLGFVYTWFMIICIVFALKISFSKIGNIKIGSGEPEFSLFSWGAMLFCAGTGASVMYLSTIEWIYYYMAPPFGIEAFSWEAAEWAATYPYFHWGPMCWMLYGLIAVPIGYNMFNRKKQTMSFARTCFDFNKKYDIFYTIIDFFIIFAFISCMATVFALEIPVITLGLSKLLGFRFTNKACILIVIIIAMLCSISVVSGIKRGIKRLSNINIFFMFIILLLVFIFGDTTFIIKSTTTSIGLLSQNLIRMMTWMDPVLDSGFVEMWTIFYWAWYVTTLSFMGVFLARISKGRTIKQIIVGVTLFGGTASLLCFSIFSNQALSQQLNNVVDMVSIINNEGPYEIVYAMLESLPMAKLSVPIYIITMIIFLATTCDSAAYTIAGSTMNKYTNDKDIKIWYRIIWVIGIILIPISFYSIGNSFEIFQTLTLVIAFPAAIIVLFALYNFHKNINKDINEK